MVIQLKLWVFLHNHQYGMYTNESVEPTKLCMFGGVNPFVKNDMTERPRPRPSHPLKTRWKKHPRIETSIFFFACRKPPSTWTLRFSRVSPSGAMVVSNRFKLSSEDFLETHGLKVPWKLPWWLPRQPCYFNAPTVVFLTINIYSSTWYSINPIIGH